MKAARGELEFRLMRLDDVQGLLSWRASDDPRFEHYSFVDFDLAEAEAWYFSKQKWLSRKLYGLFEDGEVIGFITLKKINFIAKTAEVGLAVNPEKIGAGYGEIMLKAHICSIYQNFPIDRIYLDVAEFNTRARKLYEKCGFMYCGCELRTYEHQLNKNLAFEFPDDFLMQDGRLLAKFYRMEHVRGTISLNAPAKINLGLQVGARNADGYHELCTTMQSINLCDIVHIRRVKKRRSDEADVRLRSEHEGIPPSKNLVYIAANKYLERISQLRDDLNGGAYTVEISLYKRIPQGAGLGGGSADAAAVLRGLNRLFGEVNGTARGEALSADELLGLAAEIGSDVPFCVRGGTAIATGRGEKLCFYSSVKSPWVIVLPGSQLSTASVFDRFDELFQNGAEWRDESRKKHEELRRVSSSDAAIGDFFDAISQNDIEPAAASLAGDIRERLGVISALGADFASMTGSGSAVYGLFGSESAACLAQRALGVGVYRFCDGEGS